MRALRQRDERSEKLKAAGMELEAATIEHVEQQLMRFKTELAKFARTHKASINSDPAFRHRFQEMTSSVGVDPLMSGKGFWGELLGVGDFYFELGVQILDICVSTRPVNGGVLPMSQCLARLRRARGGSEGAGSVAPAARGAAASSASLPASSGAEHGGAAISQADVERAVEKLSALGSGIAVQHAKVGGRAEAMIVSVPRELSADTAAVVAAINSAERGCSGAELAASTGWAPDRVQRALSELLAEGMLWLDQHAVGADPRYWLPGSISME